ncbi:hypothetical protein ACFPIJ_59355 [Dactylosporangium cerinum]|uniref:Uncharacterized protein n=1 Tax=Dactylosporangium cerinum TaxID=1434730 RepID=A0ABV9WG82_9ACTN
MARDGAGYRADMHLATLVTVLRQAPVRVVLPVLVLYGALVGLGLLVTRVLPGVWPLAVEDGVNRGLAAERTAGRLHTARGG